MKKNYLIIAFLFSSIVFGQTTFVNTTADGKWSTAANWSAGLPSASSTADVPLNANVNLDINQTIGGFLRSGTRTVSGTGILTSAGSFTGALLCVDTNFTFNSNLVLNGTDINTIKSLQVNNTLGSTTARQLTLGPLSVLTLTTPASVVTGSSSKVVFQGKIQGAAALFFNGVAEFDALSDNTGFNGEMVFNTNGISVIANTTGTAAFLKVNQKMQVNGTGCSLTLNGANSCNGYLNVGGANAFTLNINANQQSFGSIILANGPLTINVAPAVTNLSFANSSAITWGSGTVAITGYQTGKIRFGTTSTALTATQLSRITADGAATGLPLALDASGYLVFIDPFAYFTNATGAGDGKWSTATNWTAGALPTQSAQLSATVNLDTNQTLPGTLRSDTSTLSGTGILTSTGTVSDNIALLSIGANFTFNGNMVVNNPNTQKALRVNNTSGAAYRQLTLGPLSVLTLTTPAIVTTQFDSKVVFQGKIEGAANLNFTGASEFAAASDNTLFNGDMVFSASASTVIANTTGTGAFLKTGRQVQVNATGCSLTLNGANSCNGNINVASTHAFALNINANQGSFGTVTVTNGPLTINVAPAVTVLSFANSAAIGWGSGTVAITGYQSGEIRFGTTSAALTTAQLSRITADGAAAGLPLALDSNGYLVLGDTFSYFNNTTGNSLWSTAGNWAALLLPTQNVQLNADVNLDSNFSITGMVRNGTNTVSGTGTLTSAGTSADGLLSNGTNFIFNSNLVMNCTNVNTIKSLQVNNAVNLGNRQLTLGSSSVLTLTTPAAVITGVNSKVVFQGKIQGAAALNFGSGSSAGVAEFDTASDNRNFTGEMVFNANASAVIANTSGAGFFLRASSRVQVNATGCSLTLNGANSCNGSISVGSTHAFALNINANQASLGTVTVTNGPFTINVAAAVTTLSFADSTAIGWGTGTIAITGYQSGEIRFGTSSAALTTTQLSRITADGAAAGLALTLDSNGYLIVDPFAYFTNTAGLGNGKWSTTTNWTAGALPTQSAQLSANVDLDTNQTLPGMLRSQTNSLSGTGILTSAGTVSDGVALLSNGTNFTFNGNLVINNANIQKTLQVNNATGLGNRQLTLGSSSVLTLTTPAAVSTSVNSKVVFQGKIQGAAALNFGGAAEFDTASDNRNFSGEMVFTGTSSTVIANTNNAGYFLSSGRQVRVNATSCSLTLNGADSCNGNINVASTHAFTLNINANQGSFGTVTVTNGPLTINVAAAVTNLSFANSAAIGWGTGTVVITGYQSGEIRFGTSSTALTTAQLSRITADGAAAGLPLALDSNGYLVLGDAFSYFTNASGAGNGNWSTATNWTALRLPTQSAQLDADVNLDSNQTITGMLRSGTNTLSGTGILTSTGTVSDGTALLSNGTNFTFNGNLVINNPNIQKSLQVNTIAPFAARQLTLGSSSVLTLTTRAAVITGTNSKVVFQGKIQGTADLNFNGVSEFGTASDNTGLNADLVFTSSASTVTANTTGTGFFLKSGRKVQVNSTNCILTLNGANSCNGNVSLLTTTDFTLNINANQGSFGTITVGNAPLTINVAAAVTNLSFANSAAIAWGTGTVAFTGYQSGEIRFGTTSSALTATQLSRITADGAAAGRALSLDSNGYLVVVYTTWIGTTSTTWTDSSNWSAGVPSATSNATIGTATNQPTIASNVVINSLAIASGATLTVNEGRVLDVAGTITNSGDLILKSSATGTASLLNTSAATNVTQQRYFSSNQRGWRLLSNPLASTTFNTLAAASGITIGNNFTGEYISSSNTFTSTSGTATMDTQKAYKLFITGLSGEGPGYTTGPSNVTLINKGTAANTAPIAIATTLGDYYLVANPYTAPVSVASIIGASTGLSSTVAYYNPTNGSTNVKIKAGGYDATTATGTAGSATDVVIPAMGAIFVQAASAGTINIPRTTIFTGTAAQAGTYNHRAAQTAAAPNNVLKLEVRSGGVYYDALALQFKVVGEAGCNIDFGKLPNSILDAYTIAGNKRMAVAEVELAAQTIPLGITSTIQKSFTFKVVENTIPAGFEAVLVDKLLNTNTVLISGATYNFVIDSASSSQGDARFAINLKTVVTLSVAANELDSKIQLWPNPAHGQFNILNGQNQKDGISTIEISNLNGQMVHSRKSNPGTTTTIQTKGWLAGVYIIKIKNSGNQTTKKLIVQ